MNWTSKLEERRHGASHAHVRDYGYNVERTASRLVQTRLVIDALLVVGRHLRKLEAELLRHGESPQLVRDGVHGAVVVGDHTVGTRWSEPRRRFELVVNDETIASVECDSSGTLQVQGASTSLSGAVDCAFTAFVERLPSATGADR